MISTHLSTVWFQREMSSRFSSQLTIEAAMVASRDRALPSLTTCSKHCSMP